MNKRILPPTYLLIAILAMVALHFPLISVKLVTAPWNLLGVLPVIGGIIINFLADQALHKARTTVRPFEESTVLVSSGVYRISRNPMYLGFVCILAGVALLLGTILPWIVAPIFAVLMNHIFIRTEEEMLSLSFGKEWIDYRNKVRRWI